MLVFEDRGNRSTRGKTSRSKGEHKQQTQPTYCVDTGIWTRATSEGGECSHHCATLAPLSCLHKSFLIFPGKSSKIAYSHCTLTWLRSQCTRLKESILKNNHYIRDTELGFSFFWSFNCIFLHITSISPPQACVAFCFITIPSIDDVFVRLKLYLLSGQVAMANQALSQGEQR